MKVLTNATVVIVSQYVSVSYQHFVNLKLSQSYMSIIT